MKRRPVANAHPSRPISVRLQTGIYCLYALMQWQGIAHAANAESSLVLTTAAISVHPSRPGPKQYGSSNRTPAVATTARLPTRSHGTLPCYTLLCVIPGGLLPQCWPVESLALLSIAAAQADIMSCCNGCCTAAALNLHRCSLSPPPLGMAWLVHGQGHRPCPLHNPAGHRGWAKAHDVRVR